MSKEALKRYTRKSNEAANIQYKVISNRDGGGCGIFADNYFRQVDLAINKLGRIEDIEEEWGMPIEVIYKALKNKKESLDFDSMCNISDFDGNKDD